jgi:transposase
MAYRELFVVEIKEVLRLWARGQGYRAVARTLGVDRKTVRRYVEAATALGLSGEECGRPVDDGLVSEVVAAVRPGAPSAPGQMREHCRAHSALIKGWLDDGCRGPKIVRLLGRHSGVVVPLRTLQRFIAEELGRDGRSTSVRVVDSPPGQIVEVDFCELGRFVDRSAGESRKLHALICVASFSRHQFVWPCTGQTQQDVIEGLEAAWDFFGGVFAVVVTDNMSAVAVKADPVAPKLSQPFIEYMQARGFVVDLTRPRKPRDKARVERQVRYVRDDFFAGEDFGSVDEARTAAVRWCRDIAGIRTHGRTRRRPLEDFEEHEKPLLLPAPTEPYDEPVWTTVRLGRDHAVVVDHALYSVPCAVAPGELRARRDRSTVKLYRGAKLLKIHPRKRQGEASIDAADLPPGKAELATKDGASLQLRAERYGPSVGEYVRRLLDGPLPWTRMRRVYRLLGLGRRHGGELVDEACARALELDVVDVVRIDRMLQRGLVQRGLLHSEPPKPLRQPAKILPLRFARDPSEYRTRSHPPPGEPDVPA